MRMLNLTVAAKRKLLISDIGSLYTCYWIDITNPETMNEQEYKL